ncbi:hypothetical protein VNO77_41561 [Canavalia gladiata]|uniref:Plus3 domain-containing protein n=1 Tax=Canavalia gladiata TaxID=3824 RepID=A0AAN9JZ75_CANGL
MTLAATDPLSEIVWSPDKGLCLKCADSSFADKNSSLFRDVGSSGMVLAPPQNVTVDGSAIDQPKDDDVVKPIAVVCTKSDIAEIDAPTMHPSSDSGVKANYKAFEESDIGQADPRPFDNLLLQSDEPKPAMDQNPSPGRQSDGGVDIGKKVVVSDHDLYTAVEPIVEYKGPSVPGTNLASSSRSPLEKLESSAENDLRNFNFEATCAGTSGANANEIENNEMMPPCDKMLPVLHSPCHSIIHMAINKGKEKSLSDGDANVILSREENDSHSSVESCNSAGFFSTAKKRCNFQQQLIIGSKRVKRQIEETSGSKSYVKQDSSFMNWISNMVKGLSQSIQDDSNTLALTLANSDHHNLQSDQKLITCNMNQGPEPKNTGFKSIFQSIYCPSLKNVGTRTFREGESNEDSEPGKMEHGIDATPITCCAENNTLSKLCFQSNKFEVFTERYDAGPSSQPDIKPLNFFNSQESSKNNLLENKNCSILGLGKNKEEVASHSSSTKQNTDNNDNDNVNSNALSDRKEEENICHRRDNMGSLWITRFSPKFTALLKEQAANDTEVSTGPKEDKGNNDHKSKHKYKPPSSSSGFRNLEPMASMFARRFGAIKHVPTNTTDNTTQVNMLCLFCGTRGHQLSNCSVIAESELEDVQKNIESYGGLEEQPCLCIKCYQSNHWAVSCPISISTRKHKLEVNAMFSDHGKHFIPSNEGSARPLTDEDDQVLSGDSINDKTDQQPGQNFNLKRKSDFNAGCNTSFKKYCDSSPEENKFKQNPISSPSRLAERKTLQVPNEIFDAVKKLRLSRTDILKWINTHGSISQLDGFFLRLRLGKWEEGLGGTGYHVAYINVTETQRQSLEQDTRKSLSVKVGGIKCMIESQYISNHDFLEEEIMEWWSTTSEAGAKIPSEEDLIEKFKKKKMLGL